jgi:hypothetical protein
MPFRPAHDVRNAAIRALRSVSRSRAIGTGDLELDMILIGLSEKGVSLEIFTFECGRVT